MIKNSSHQFGGAMIYILLAIGMLAILTGILSEGGNQQSQTQNATKLISEVSSQIDSISGVIQECVLNYPNQDAKLTPTYQKNPNYPLSASSSYYTAMSATPGPSGSASMQGIRCPGNPGGTDPNSQNHAFIFTGTNGKFFPAVPKPFDVWRYSNDAAGVFVMFTAPNNDANVNTLTKLDSKYAPCESDVIINATGSSITVNVTGNTCGANGVCFRYWILRKPGSIPADTACP